MQERIVSSCGQKPAIEVACKPLNYERVENFGLDEKRVQHAVQAAFEHKKVEAQNQEKISKSEDFGSKDFIHSKGAAEGVCTNQ